MLETREFGISILPNVVFEEEFGFNILPEPPPEPPPHAANANIEVKRVRFFMFRPFFIAIKNKPPKEYWRSGTFKIML